MDSDRPGGDASRPGDLPSESGEWTAAQQGGRASPSDQPPAGTGDAPSSQHPRFAVGGRLTSAAERSSALGSAPRQPRHGLEVVHAAEHSHAVERTAFERTGVERTEETRESQSQHQPPPQDDIAARMMREIEEAVAEIRRHAAGRLISLQRPERVYPSGVVYEFLARIQQRVRRLATEKPMQTAAVVIAIGLAFGAVLRLRK
jgi:hypothetical protein